QILGILQCHQAGCTIFGTSGFDYPGQRHSGTQVQPPGMSSISCVGNAVEALTRALALELAPRRVNVVAPGIIDTGMFDRLGDNKAAALAQMGKNVPLGRVGQANEVAGAIVHAMTNTYMTGATLDVDGGSLLP
ncbi:MAG: SDR family oxidoreductase, partial [Pseudomonadales bacterium]